MAVNFKENPLYFLLFQVLVTLSLNMKVDLRVPRPRFRPNTIYSAVRSNPTKHSAILSYLRLD